MMPAARADVADALVRRKGGVDSLLLRGGLGGCEARIVDRATASDSTATAASSAVGNVVGLLRLLQLLLLLLELLLLLLLLRRLLALLELLLLLLHLLLRVRTLRRSVRVRSAVCRRRCRQRLGADDLRTRRSLVGAPVVRVLLLSEVRHGRSTNEGKEREEERRGGRRLRCKQHTIHTQASKQRANVSIDTGQTHKRRSLLALRAGHRAANPRGARVHEGGTVAPRDVLFGR